MNLSRRDVLRMLSAVGAGTMLPSIAGRQNARADAPRVPKRIVFFYTEQGTYQPSWAPTAPGAPAAETLTAPWSTPTYTLGDLHRPLAGLENRLLFLEGIDMVSASVDTSQPQNAHAAGETHALVANKRLAPSTAGGISIDQLIAQSINLPTPVTSLPSLELYVGDTGRDGIGRPLYSAPGAAIPIPGSPSDVYDRILPNGPRGNTPAERDAVARKILERQLALDFAKQRFASAGSSLGRADRERLAAHAAAVHDLSTRLAIGGSAACREPARGIVAGSGYGKYDYNADVMIRLLQTALACDLTRVATLYVSEPRDPTLFGYRPVDGTADFHAMVHDTQGVNAGDPGRLHDNPVAIGIVKNFHAYMASLYGKLLRLLDQIPEADGGTLLDHTLVVWCGQIASGNHSLDHVPYVLGGRMGGAVQTGRYVRYPRQKTGSGDRTRGPAHNDLFVGLANRMDVPITTFGDAAVCTGALGGLS